MSSSTTICVNVLLLAVIGWGFAQAQKTADAHLRFESGTRSDGHPKGWGGGGQDYELTLDTQRAHSGKACGRIRYGGSSPDGFGTFTTMAPVEKYRGKHVRYTGWLRCKDVKRGWAGMWMRVDGQTPGEVLAFDNMGDRPVKGTSAWTRYQIELDVPVSARAILFGFLLAGDGSLWGDDFRLEVTGPSK